MGFDDPAPSLTSRPTMSLIELTYLAQHWQPTEEPPLYGFWMASSDVDQKFLGHYAKTIAHENGYLSSFLFRVLGLSIILSEKLLEARKARRLDPVRDVKARQSIHHILWLAREGLVMIEQYVLPMVGNQTELKVLSYKLRASFYHIFVLFHNDPPVNPRVVRGRSGSTSSAGTTARYTLFPDPLAPKSKSQSSREPIRSPSGRMRSPAVSLGVGHGASDSKKPTPVPPGLGVPPPFSTTPYSTIHFNGVGSIDHEGSLRAAINDPSLATYLMPLTDYTPHATAAFKAAAAHADSLLPGSHPVRLSVKVEYVAYVYDCLKEHDRSRKMAKMAIRSVYESTAAMNDEDFEDASELVGLLGRMMKRGLGGGPSSLGGSESQLGAEVTAKSPAIVSTAPAGRTSGQSKASAATNTVHRYGQMNGSKSTGSTPPREGVSGVKRKPQQPASQVQQSPSPPQSRQRAAQAATKKQYTIYPQQPQPTTWV